MNDFDEDASSAAENITDEKIIGSPTIFDCLKESKYSAKEIAVLLHVNNLLQMRLIAYTEISKISDYNERRIFRNNIGRISEDLRDAIKCLDADIGYQNCRVIDIDPN